jgi:hypothetical protein
MRHVALTDNVHKPGPDPEQRDGSYKEPLTTHSGIEEGTAAWEFLGSMCGLFQ